MDVVELPLELIISCAQSTAQQSGGNVQTKGSAVASGFRQMPISQSSQWHRFLICIYKPNMAISGIRLSN